MKTFAVKNTTNTILTAHNLLCSRLLFKENTFPLQKPQLKAV